MKCNICTQETGNSEPVHAECVAGTRCESCRWHEAGCAVCNQCIDYDKHNLRDSTQQPKPHVMGPLYMSTGDNANEMP